MSRLFARVRLSAPVARVPRTVTRSASTSTHASPGSSTSWHLKALLGGATVAVAGYTLSETLRLDSVATKRKQLIPYSEVQKHSTVDDCWVVLEGKVYDLTKFAKIHPGGENPIHRVAGHDATAIFAPIHSKGIIEDRLDPSAYVGDVDESTLPDIPTPTTAPASERKVDLGEIVGLPDFEAAAQANLTDKAWAYISAGATDMKSLDLNRSAWNEILFRPRVLVDVETVDMSTSMMGHSTAVPFFICPTGMSKLAHKAGEPGLASAAGEAGVIQIVSTNSSAPIEATVGGRSHPDQVQFMQLYVDKQRANSEALLRKVHDLDMKAVFVTVDCPAPGKREADERSRAAIEISSGISGGTIKADKKGGGIGRTTGAYIDPKLNWDDIKWLRRNTPLPIGVKGIQCVEDAIRCADAGVDAIYLSNHGGRALDTSPPALYTLLEINKLAPEVLQKCEVYIDGGVRRGTDVIKALCLGARGVGMGRPFLYALTYGPEGVSHAIEIMKDEIEVTMKLLGVNKLSELGPHLLNTRALDSKVVEEVQYGKNERYLPRKS